MKKLKYLLFLFILFVVPNVFAKDVTNYIQYDSDNPLGTYKGDEIDLGGYNGKFDVKTRYNGRLSMVEFVLSSDYFDFNTNTTYTITLNMATNDWRNNFMGPQVIKLNSNGSEQTSNGSLTVSNFQFVSRKTIKFNFKTNNSISPFLKFRLYSTNYATSNTIAITGDSNWNLSSIVITSASSSSGSSSSGSSSSGSGSTSNGGASVSGSTLTCNNGLVLSSNIYNSSKITIDNYYLTSSGSQTSASTYGIVQYIPITPNTTYLLIRSNNLSSTASYCLYNSSKTLISCNDYEVDTNFTINTGNAYYLSLSLYKSGSMTLSSCVSSVDNQNQNTQSIIDNENQNTTNIIDNNNDNTQQIIDNQNQNAENTENNINNSLGNVCRDSLNLIKHKEDSYFRLGTNVSYSRGSFVLNGSVKTTGNVIGASISTLSSAFSLGTFEPGTYYFKISKSGGSYSYNSSSNGFYIKDSSGNNVADFGIASSSFNSYGSSFTLNERTELFARWYFSSAGFVFNNLKLDMMISSGSSAIDFEQTGRICTNKLDIINGAIGAGAQSVMDNANQNSQDIMDNANQNAENTQNVINNSLGNVCRPSINLFSHADLTKTQNNVKYSYSKGIFTLNGTTLNSGFVIGHNSNDSLKFSFGTFEPGTYTFSFKKIAGSLSYSSGSSALYVRISGDNSTIFSTSITKNTTTYNYTFTLAEQQELFLSYFSASSWTFTNYQLQFQVANGSSVLSFEPPGEICTNKLDDVNSSINDVNDTLNNSNIDNDVGTGFFDDFTNEDFGLSQIITIPLNTIQSLTSKSCVPLQVPIPFTNSNISLPCMTEIYESKFPSIYNLWKIVSFGIVAYLIAIDIFHIVKGFKDPESDKVEVLDL